MGRHFCTGRCQAVEALVVAGASHTPYELLLAGLEDRVCGHLDENPQAIVELLDGDIPPLHAALSTPAGTRLVSLLRQRGVHIEQRDGLGRKAFHKAIDHDQAEAMSLLSEGLEFDIFAAAGLGDTARVDEQVESDPARSDAAQTGCTTPLFYAVLSSSFGGAIAMLLLITPIHAGSYHSGAPEHRRRSIATLASSLGVHHPTSSRNHTSRHSAG